MTGLGLGCSLKDGERARGKGRVSGWWQKRWCCDVGAAPALAPHMLEAGVVGISDMLPYLCQLYQLHVEDGHPAGAGVIDSPYGGNSSFQGSDA